jgi:hypothetical protein
MASTARKARSVSVIFVTLFPLFMRPRDARDAPIVSASPSINGGAILTPLSIKNWISSRGEEVANA